MSPATGVDGDRVAGALSAYQVGPELGRGTWGIVLAGQHRRLSRPVAIKVLSWAFGADEVVRGRFLAEARLLSTLDHPHIVPIYDYVEKDGLCLLVMERMTGGTLRERLRPQGGGPTPQLSCAVLLAVCAALAHAHGRGVLHRDIKPDNLMLAGDNKVKVTDFGLAKLIGGSDTAASMAGAIHGTPAYIAPEQAMGGELGPATDVYAAGTILYELLSRQLPFPETNSPYTALYQHAHGRPRPLLDVAPLTPARLALVVDRALASSPADRYQSAEEFGVSVAESAAEAWGSDWLAATGMPVAIGGRILASALKVAPSERPTGSIPATTVHRQPTRRYAPEHRPDQRRRGRSRRLVAAGATALLASTAIIVGLSMSGGGTHQSVNTPTSPVPFQAPGDMGIFDPIGTPSTTATTSTMPPQTGFARAIVPSTSAARNIVPRTTTFITTRPPVRVRTSTTATTSSSTSTTSSSTSTTSSSSTTTSLSTPATTKATSG